MAVVAHKINFPGTCRGVGLFAAIRATGTGRCSLLGCVAALQRCSKRWRLRQKPGDALASEHGDP
jgi:hypothetical protein